jgi:hypothetical protein
MHNDGSRWYTANSVFAATACLYIYKYSPCTVGYIYCTRYRIQQTLLSGHKSGPFAMKQVFSTPLNNGTKHTNPSTISAHIQKSIIGLPMYRLYTVFVCKFKKLFVFRNIKHKAKQPSVKIRKNTWIFGGPSISILDPWNVNQVGYELQTLSTVYIYSTATRVQQH